MKFKQFFSCVISAFVFMQVALYAAAVMAAPDATYAIHIGTLIQDAVNFIFVGLGAFVIWMVGSVIHKIETKTGLEIDAKFRAYLYDAIDRAIEYGKAEAESYVGDIKPMQTRHEIVGIAANYLIERVPDALKHFGFTEEALRKYLRTRLEASSPELKRAA